jgi:hypothetical protein
MLKQYSVFLAAGLLPLCVYAQNLTPPVGIGVTTPRFTLHVSTANTLGLGVQNTEAISVSSGAFLRLYNSGLPTAGSQRLGGVLMGVFPASGVLSTGAQIESVSEAAWVEGSSHPAALKFLTVPANSTTVTERLRITADGDVGIGTASPLASTTNNGLHISRGNHSTVTLGDPFAGYGGFVQTTDNKHRVFIGANVYDDATNSWKVVQAGKGLAGISIVADEGGWGTSIDFYTNTGATLNKNMTILGNGNVGIGTSTPGSYKLAVEGSFGARKVKVTQAAWADFVFDPGYQLPSLHQVEQYIREHRHLPEIPSEKEVKENGLDLGDMDKRLLQKIEELTLYLLDMNKQNQELKATVDDLKAKVEQLNKHHQ